MPEDNHFRIHRDSSVPSPDPEPLLDDGVEEYEVAPKPDFGWPAAATTIAFFALLGFLFWLFVK